MLHRSHVNLVSTIKLNHHYSPWPWESYFNNKMRRSWGISANLINCINPRPPLAEGSLLRINIYNFHLDLQKNNSFHCCSPPSYKSVPTYGNIIVTSFNQPCLWKWQNAKETPLNRKWPPSLQFDHEWWNMNKR